MNFILDKLEELENTVNNLGQLNQIKIDRIIPLAGAPVDTLIRIEGANFLHPPGDNIVRIAGELVVEFASPSTSGILTCRVPDTIDVNDDDGEPFVVRVENTKYGATEADYILFPESSQPEILINTVLTETGSTTLNMRAPAIITGENFSTNADLNEIRLEWIGPAGSTTAFATEKEMISTTPGDMQMRFTVPEIPRFPSGQVRPVVVRLRFDERSDEETVSVRGS
ncbi:MAG TPA: hypothetical protein DDY14_15945 [Chromatiaceae bacterium]|nr:MAG: hypothetical protein N838_01645 [Thiohalocapsa sp. PB-PSB1]HBG96775.1 hypothetical protein [Chromatiaceae bacterium]HCS91254.1 hypothetical protein [Chromatiaceae bacterium]